VLRAAGLVELDRELDRCRRTNGQLAVAYVDVIGLKALNDSAGHSAGDELLERVVTHIRSHLRSYDLIIRVGGDEFVCAMSDMTLLDARQRFHDVAATLTAEPQAGAIRSGLAQLTAHDTAAQLIARADRDLLDSPHTNH
jgi:diguanylate cyclase (GGDEF)-like protein